MLLLLATAASLILAGGFAMLLAASGEFLSHDIAYLGMSAADLCSIARCHIVDFMIHDRAAFGGALFGIGVLYTYLVLFPLRQGQAWAWWLLAISGSVGFLSFLVLLPVVLIADQGPVGGDAGLRRRRPGSRDRRPLVRRILRPVAPRAWPCRRGIHDRGADADVPAGHASQGSDLIQL